MKQHTAADSELVDLAQIASDDPQKLSDLTVTLRHRPRSIAVGSVIARRHISSAAPEPRSFPRTWPFQGGSVNTTWDRPALQRLYFEKCQLDPATTGHFLAEIDQPVAVSTDVPR